MNLCMSALCHVLFAGVCATSVASVAASDGAACSADGACNAEAFEETSLLQARSRNEALASAKAALEGPPSMLQQRRAEQAAEAEAATKDWKFTCSSGPTKARWTNFQGIRKCQKESMFYCPDSLVDLQDVVKSHADVRASGMLHSWTPFACPENDPGVDSATVSTFKFNQILSLNTANKTVLTQGGVSTRELMNWLAERGYVLPSVPFWIDQTVAGAVATNTHGSAMKQGTTSMSAMVRSMDLVLADGSLKHLVQGDEELRAARVSVGKLGVIYQLELEVEEDYCITGTKEHWSEKLFTLWLEGLKSPKATSQIANPAKDQLAIQMFWFPNKGIITGNHRTVTGPAAGCPVTVNSTFNGAPTDAMGKVDFPLISRMRQTFPESYEMIELWMIEGTMFCDGVCLASERQIVPTALTGEIAPDDKYDQSEWGVPIAQAATCFHELATKVVPKDSHERRLFLAAPVLLRFVGQEDSFLSFSTDGPHMLFNMNSDVAYRSHEAHECRTWDAVIAHMEGPSCNGRLHWGKTGWDSKDHAQAAKMYPNFPDFIKVMKDWDPTGKFVGGSPVFDPSAPKPVLGSCAGTSAECKKPERQASRCMCTAQTPSWWDTCEWQLPQA